MRKANETNNKKMPVAVEVVDLLGDDASVAYCDPVTGLCVVPGGDAPSAAADTEQVKAKTKGDGETAGKADRDK